MHDRLDRIIGFDDARGVVDCEAGVTVRRSPQLGGAARMVSPGDARAPSSSRSAGALAADVHGKNHHRDGTIAAFIDHFTPVSHPRTGRDDALHRRNRSTPTSSGPRVGGMGHTRHDPCRRVRLRLRPASRGGWLRVQYLESSRTSDEARSVACFASRRTSELALTRWRGSDCHAARSRRATGRTMRQARRITRRATMATMAGKQIPLVRAAPRDAP
jgi:FAD/FMN-containing dehydrogenase